MYGTGVAPVGTSFRRALRPLEVGLRGLGSYTFLNWLDKRTGSLTPGKEADVILLTANAINVIPLTTPMRSCSAWT